MGGKSGSSAPKSLDYYGTIAGAVGWGPLDWLTAIINNGNYVWQCSAGGPLDLTSAYNASGYLDLTASLLDPSMIADGGYFRLYGGLPDPNQSPDPALVGHPSYSDTVVIVAKHLFFGENSGTAPNIQLIGGRIPRVPTSIVAAIDNIADDRQINPVAFLAEFLLDERGKGMTEDQLDAPSWLVAGHRCARDQAARDYCFCSPLITEQTALRQIVKNLLDPIDGFLRWLPNGKLGIFIYEWGVDPGGLTTLDARHFTKDPEVDDGTWEDVPTTVTVSFTDRAYEFQENTVLAPNEVAAQIRKVYDPAQLDRKYVMRRPQAQLHGLEYNRRMGLAPGTGILYVRKPWAAGILPGDKIKYDDDPEPGGSGLAQLARVEKIESDRTDEVKISITLDPLLPAVSYTPAWTSPLPEAGFAGAVESAPSLAHLQAIPLPPATFGWPPAVGFLTTRPSSKVAGFNAYFATNPAGSFAELGAQPGFAARAQLVSTVASGAGTLRLQLLDGAAGPEAYLAANTPGGNATQAADDTLLAVLIALDGSNRVSIDGAGEPIMEFASIQQRSAVTSDTHDYTVLRGRCSLAARAWTGGAVAWIVPKVNLIAWRHGLFTSLLGSAAYFRLAAYTSAAVDESATLPESDMVFPTAYRADQPATYTVSLSTEAHTVACDVSGTPLTGQLGASSTAKTTVTVLRNGIALTAVSGTPTADQFSIALGTLISTTATIEGTNVVRADSLTADTGTIAINVLVGNAFTVIKAFALSKAYTGATGATGAVGNTQVRLYKRSALVPSTPTGDSPSGWTTAIPSGTDALWAVDGVKDSSGHLVGSWSTPQRISGNIIFYQSGLPSSGSYTLLDGDTAFDLADNFKIYRWNGSSWVAAFQPFPTTDGSGHVTGLTTVGGSGAFAIVCSDFQIYNGATNDVPFEIVSGVTYIKNALIQTLAAGKITAGTITAALTLGSAGSLASGSGANAFYNDLNGTVLGDPSGVHFMFATDGSQTNLTLLNGGTIKGFWTYNAGAGLTTFDAGGGNIQNAGSVKSTHIQGNSTLDPRDNTAPVTSLGGAYITKSLDVHGKSYLGDDTAVTGNLHVTGHADIDGNINTAGAFCKETPDGWAPPLYSGNLLSFKWDGTSPHLKVDASDFLLPCAATIGSAITSPSGGATQDAEARTAIDAIRVILTAWGLTL